MRRIRQVLQLHFGVRASARVIAETAGIGRSTVQDYLARAAAAGLAWPLPADLTDEALEHLLFPAPGNGPGARRHVEPDWPTLVREMKRPGVNLSVLFEEYQGVHPDGYKYSRFCQLYRAFERRLSPTMRQAHVAGDKAFVDYSGKKVPIVDPLSGEVRMAELFIAVLGASNLTYADATWTQGLPDWIGAHVRMFRFFGGAPRLLIPDNLKSGINKPSFYDPEVNRSYGRLAAHYNVGVVPARPRKPKDKAAVEAGVRFAQSYVLGRLRNVTFFSLAECQAAIAAALERMNGREMRRLGVSRRQLFEAIERPVMQSLPEQDYEYAEWHFARVGIDYHVEVQGFFYSVPHALIREQVDTRATASTIEVFHRGKRVASHVRRYGGQRHGTLPDHMPSAHRRYAEWSADRFTRQARDIGPDTEALILAVLARRPHPEQGFRTCIGLLRLFRGLDAARAEAASRRAVEIGALTHASVASILKHGLDRSAPLQAADGAPLLHENIRGSGYFH
jgi:transposase